MHGPGDRNETDRLDEEDLIPNHQPSDHERSPKALSEQAPVTSIVTRRFAGPPTVRWRVVASRVLRFHGFGFGVFSGSLIRVPI